MSTFETPGELSTAIADYLFGGPEASKLPEELRGKLQSAASESPAIKAAALFAETVYANRGYCDKKLLSLAANIVSFCVEYELSTPRGERGFAMGQALRREAGEKKPGGGKWPAEKNDPEPKAGREIKAPKSDA